MSQRFAITNNGKYHGGTFATKAEAEAVAKRLPGTSVVHPKGSPPDAPKK